MTEEVTTQAPDLYDERYYINRELSWLEFNRRCLAEAMDESNPLLERVKFLAICYGNMDEFFMIRVPGIMAKTPIPGPDYLNVNYNVLMEQISTTVQQLVQQGGVLVDGEKVTDPKAVLTVDALNKGVVIKKGKKVYHKVTL